jgi:hypothetical protein
MIDGQRNKKKLHLSGAQLFQILFHGANLIVPKKKSLLGRLAAVGTSRGEFPSMLIRTSCWRTRTSTKSQIWRYSTNTCTVRTPLTSATQYQLFRAWTTVLLLTILLEINLHKLGANSASLSCWWLFGLSPIYGGSCCWHTLKSIEPSSICTTSLW